MSNLASEAWIEAAERLAIDPSERIPCPACGKGILKVRDVPWQKDPTYFERYLYCENCKSQNVMRMRRQNDD